MNLRTIFISASCLLALTPAPVLATTYLFEVTVSAPGSPAPTIFIQSWEASALSVYPPTYHDFGNGSGLLRTYTYAPMAISNSPFTSEVVSASGVSPFTGAGSLIAEHGVYYDNNQPSGLSAGQIRLENVIVQKISLGDGTYDYRQYVQALGPVGINFSELSEIQSIDEERLTQLLYRADYFIWSEHGVRDTVTDREYLARISEASYSGTARFLGVQSAVPEPTTWATMLLGFGLIGGAMRYRRRPKVTVRYA